MDKETLAASRFACSDRERAMFEAGIKMGTIYHQFVGTPLDSGSVEDLERTMSRTIEVQPCVESARITIDRSRIPGGDGMFQYTSLTGDMIDAVVTVKVGESVVTAEMRYDDELQYPLMYVSRVQ